MGTSHAQIQDCYISYYQRPGDAYGLVYWERYPDDFGSVQAAFGSSAESQRIYGPINSATIGNVVDMIYIWLFKRAPDAAGKAFYVDGFNAGTFTPVSIAYSIMTGAQGKDLENVQRMRDQANFMSRQAVSQNCAWVQITPGENSTLIALGVNVPQYNNFYTVGGSGGLGLSERPDAVSPIGYVYTDHGDVQLPDVDQAADKRIAVLAAEQGRPVPPPANLPPLA